MAYSVMVGPILWFVHFLAVYILAEFGCRMNFSNMIFITPASIRLWVAILTVLLLIPVAAGGLLAYRNWRRLPEKGGALDAKLQFLVVGGMLLSALFVVSILVTAMPAYFVGVCDQAA